MDFWVVTFSVEPVIQIATDGGWLHYCCTAVALLLH